MACSGEAVIWYISATLYRKEAEEPSATSVSMLGEPCRSPLKPLTKNFWLTTMTMAVSSSSVSAMAMGLSARKAGSGQCHMTCPMEMYISSTRKPIDHKSRRRSKGVS